MEGIIPMNRLLKSAAATFMILGFIAAPASFAASYTPNVASGSNTPSWNQRHSPNSQYRQSTIVDQVI